MPELTQMNLCTFDRLKSVPTSFTPILSFSCVYIWALQLVVSGAVISAPIVEPAPKHLDFAWARLGVTRAARIVEHIADAG
jgi:hypothetical protein